MWTGAKEFRRRRADAKQACRFRKLRFEALETRIHLAGLYNWTPKATTNWNDAGNWATVTVNGITPPNLGAHRRRRISSSSLPAAVRSAL